MVVAAEGCVAILLMVVAVGVVQEKGQGGLLIRGTEVEWNLRVVNR